MTSDLSTHHMPCPTQDNIEMPVTAADQAGLAMATHSVLGQVERRTGVRLTLPDARDIAVVVLSDYLRTYRRVAIRREAIAAERMAELG